MNTDLKNIEEKLLTDFKADPGNWAWYANETQFSKKFGPRNIFVRIDAMPGAIPRGWIDTVPASEEFAVAWDDTRRGYETAKQQIKNNETINGLKLALGL